MEERKDIHQIWLRHMDDCIKNFRSSFSNLSLEPNILKTLSSVEYRMVKSPHGGNWCGFSWNPGLRRTSDYNRLFPAGYSYYHLQGEYAEYLCDHYAGSQGYRAAYLINSACNHIGFYTSTYDK